jgi:hypothetical protein
MPHYPQNATGLQYITYPVGPTVSSSVAIDPGVTPHTKGAYVQIVASTPFATSAIRVGLAGHSNSIQAWLCDLATGAAGAEAVLLANLMSDMTTTGSTIGNAGWHEFPLAIPAGTRLAARCQCSVAFARLLGIYVVLIAAGGTPGVTAVTTYGAIPATTRGTNLDPGSTINTKGAYAQLTPSTTGVTQWLMLQAAHFGGSEPSGAGWAIDVATGAAGAEVVLVPDLRVQMPAGASGTIIPRSHQMLTYIPAGTRLAARCSSTHPTAVLRTLDVTLLAATAPVESAGGGVTVATGYVG